MSLPGNPRPLVPVDQRALVLNLLHHQDHANEVLRRVSKYYYWPSLKKNVEEFVRTRHPCQLVKQAITINPGVGHFPVPDQRFSHIHLDSLPLGRMPQPITSKSIPLSRLLQVIASWSMPLGRMPQAITSKSMPLGRLPQAINTQGVPLGRLPQAITG